MSDTHKQVAIVTGASGGIGLGLVEALLARGYSVVATSRSASKSKALQASETLALVDGDIGKKSTTVAVAETAVKRFGRIDLLVNNAGIFVPKPFLSTLRTTLKIWSAQMSRVSFTCRSR